MDPLPTSALDAGGIAGAFSARDVSLAALGAGYLVLLANAVAGAILYLLARRYLVITPNRASRHYGAYTAAVLLSLVLATVLENELVPGRPTTLAYAALPHIALLFAIHWRIHVRQEPWLVALGIASIAGAVPAAGAAAVLGAPIGAAHWLSLLAACLLGVWLWIKSICTTHAFTSASSIYLASKEDDDAPAAAQTPWLGLGQWVALGAGSLALATLNSTLRGNLLTEVPVLGVLAESLALLAATTLIAAVPAASYWRIHRAWMPELGRFVWLVWLVVGFAASYGAYLEHLEAGG